MTGGKRIDDADIRTALAADIFDCRNLVNALLGTFLNQSTERPAKERDRTIAMLEALQVRLDNMFTCYVEGNLVH